MMTPMQKNGTPKAPEKTAAEGAKPTKGFPGDRGIIERAVEGAKPAAPKK